MRKQLSVLVFFSFLFFGAAPVRGQQKVYREAAVWPELQVDYVFKSTSFLYFRNNYRHVLDHDFNYLREKGALQYLQLVQFRLGYEHAFNRHWSGGVQETFAFERTRNILFNEIFVRHFGTLGKYRFSQRASLEHLMRWPKNDNGRFRLRADLDRMITLGRQSLRPRVSSELFFNLSYQPPGSLAAQTRVVDRHRIRLECQVALNSHLALTPFFIRQTDLFFVEPVFDENNQVIRAGGKQDHITPVWGVECRVALFEGGKAFSRLLPAK